MVVDVEVKVCGHADGRVKVSSTLYVLVMESFERKGYVFYLGAQTPWFLKPLDYFYRNSYSECSDYVADSIGGPWVVRNHVSGNWEILWDLTPNMKLANEEVAAHF